MASVYEKFRMVNRQQHLWSVDDKVVLAVSTGLDSMVLLNLFLRLPKDDRPEIVVAHVNHELRLASDKEEMFLRDYLAERNVPLVVAHWDKHKHPDTGTEAAARDFRYAFFEQVMQDQHATVLATAHQQDEQAETALMRLAEGRGFDETLTIAWQRPFTSGRLVRPLLQISKDELHSYVKRFEIPYFEDETNNDVTMTRNKIRHQVLPQFTLQNPRFTVDFTENLAEHAEVMQYVHAAAKQMVQASNHSVTKLLDNPLPTTLLLKTAFSDVAPAAMVTRGAWQNAAAALVNGTSQIDIPLNGEWQLQRRYDQYEFVRIEKNDSEPLRDVETMVTLNKWTQLTDNIAIGAFFEDATVTLFPNWHSVHLQLAPKQLPLAVRYARADDQLVLANGGHQSVRRLLINAKVSREERDQQLLVVDALGTPLWLVGQRVSAIHLIEPQQQLIEICVNLRQGVNHG